MGGGTAVEMPCNTELETLCTVGFSCTFGDGGREARAEDCRVYLAGSRIAAAAGFTADAG